MPNWSPNWNDVRWDHGAAEAAMSALQRAADELDRVAGERARGVISLLAEWRGVHRETFNQRILQADKEDHSLAEELRQAAQQVARLNQQAREEQARRERDREEWERERDRERDREREREEQASSNA